jgi:hypothetical protein
VIQHEKFIVLLYARQHYWLKAASLHAFEQKWSALLLGIFKHMMQAFT